MSPADKRLDRIETNQDRMAAIQGEISDNVTKALTILEEMAKLKMNERLSYVEGVINKAWGWCMAMTAGGTLTGYGISKIFH